MPQSMVPSVPQCHKDPQSSRSSPKFRNHVHPAAPPRLTHGSFGAVGLRTTAFYAAAADFVPTAAKLLLVRFSFCITKFRRQKMPERRPQPLPQQNWVFVALRDFVPSAYNAVHPDGTDGTPYLHRQLRNKVASAAVVLRRIAFSISKFEFKICLLIKQTSNEVIYKKLCCIRNNVPHRSSLAVGVAA
jgi:hypothetical protein